MIRRIAWSLIGPLALLLVVGSIHGAIQRKISACWLGAGDWHLQEGEKDAHLVELAGKAEASSPRRIRWDRVETSRDVKWKHDRWVVSAPTIKSETGKFLSYALKGREPAVYLTKDKGDHTRWVFEIVERVRPERSKSSDRNMKEGSEGFSFRVQAAEGQFKNWYLAAEDAPKDKKEPVKRRLTLVRSKKQATEFEYVQTCYYVHHP
jgi:hypothetical protein